MTQAERRIFLIKTLLGEEERYKGLAIPENEREQREMLRSLMNVRPPRPISAEFLAVQDDYLKEVIAEKGVTDIASLSPVQDDLYIWQGDITLLRCDAIVNAANSGMTGCYHPLHSCIDNCIHSYAGVQLRLKCGEIMAAQGFPEPTGQAKITPAYNLPCRFVLHTVGPIVSGALTQEHCELLASCYRSCLDLAAENGCGSIAFCCISTGVFMFPNRKAAEIAVKTVKDWKRASGSAIKVIFNVFKNADLAIYRDILAAD